MRTIYNNLEDKDIFSSTNDTDFVLFVREIAIENEDYSIMINNTLSAKEYIENFCDNLELKIN